MGWRENEKWKVVFPEQKIFLMKHHNWAFVAWDLARDNGWIEDNSTLIHIDQHLDAAIDGAMVPGLLQAKGLKELTTLTKEVTGNSSYVGIDNFIWAGFARETIQNIVYVSPERSDDLFDIEEHNKFLKEHIDVSRIEKLRGCSLKSIEIFECAKKNNVMKDVENGSLILDLDLDFFAVEDKNENGHTIYVLKELEVIRRDLKKIRDIYEWDIITVALSPEDCYIGGPDNAEIVLKEFLEIFQVDFSKAEEWSVLESESGK